MLRTSGTVFFVAGTAIIAAKAFLMRIPAQGMAAEILLLRRLQARQRPDPGVPAAAPAAEKIAAHSPVPARHRNPGPSGNLTRPAGLAGFFPNPTDRRRRRHAPKKPLQSKRLFSFDR